MHASLAENTIKRVALVAGIISLVCGVAMSFEYGRAMSYTHGLLLAMLGVAGAIAFSGADMMRARGRPLVAGIITAAGILCLIGEYTTHFGYTVGSRATDTQQTIMHNANLETLRENRKNEQANLDMWRKQLIELTNANAWAASVKADGLRSELATLSERIEAERAGKRGRAAGCKAECEKLQNERNALERRIAIIEQQADLTKRIEATQRILDQKIDTVAATGYRSSKIINQSIGFAQISTGEIEPSATAVGWTQIILGAVIALFTTFLAPLLLQIAMPDLAGRQDHTQSQPTTDARHTVIRERDDRIDRARQAFAKFAGAH